jgi:WD40 repeat protein
MKEIASLCLVATVLGSLLLAVAAQAGDQLPRIGEPPLPAQEKLDDSTGQEVFFSSDSHRLLTKYGGNARIWDIKTLKPLGDEIKRGWLITKIYFVANGSIVFASSRPEENGTRRAQYFDANTGAAIGPEFDLGKLGDAASSGDGKFLAEALVDPRGKEGEGDLQVYDRATSHVVYSKTFPRSIGEIRLNQNGSALLYLEAVSAQDRAVHLLRLRDGKLLFEHELSRLTDWELGGADFSPDGMSVAVGNEGGFKIFDLGNEKVIVDVPKIGPPGADRPAISGVGFRGDGHVLGVARPGGGGWRWNIATAQASHLDLGCVTHFGSYSNDCKRMSCAFERHEAGKLVEVGCAVFDMETGKAIWKWPNPDSFRLVHTALTPDGQRVAISCSKSGIVYVVDLNDLPLGPGATQPPK